MQKENEAILHLPLFIDMDRLLPVQLQNKVVNTVGFGSAIKYTEAVASA